MSPRVSVPEVLETRCCGFPAIGLRTDRAELLMVPSLGGRVVSLKSRRSGREWCWHRPEAQWLWANRLGDNFASSPQAGMDECLPTVSACDWKGRALPDHGEVWALEWKVDPQQLSQGVLAAAVTLPVSPFRFRRAISALPDGGFLFEYELTNLGPLHEEYAWCIHPLLALTPGDRLELPAEVRELRVNGGIGNHPIELGDRWNYPEPYPGVRLDRLDSPGSEIGCVKGFAGPMPPLARVALANPDSGDFLELRWDGRLNPDLGIWLNRGMEGFHHLGLEPGMGAPDSLADAVHEWQRFGMLQPHEHRRWSLEWRVG